MGPFNHRSGGGTPPIRRWLKQTLIAGGIVCLIKSLEKSNDILRLVLKFKIENTQHPIRWTLCLTFVFLPPCNGLSVYTQKPCKLGLRQIHPLTEKADFLAAQNFPAHHQMMRNGAVQVILIFNSD